MTRNNIPKIINYCWFGKGKKSEKIEKCINSWKKYCPDYEIKEWNEDNFDINQNYYCQKFYKKKQWAFVSDYSRIFILYNYGGIYLDTDIEIVKNIDKLVENKDFTGFQDISNIGCCFMGAKKGNIIIKEILEYYKTKRIRIVLPNLMNKIFKKHTSIKYKNSPIELKNFIIYPKDYFYPYAYFEKPENMKITENTYAIHYFYGSWMPKIITKIVFPIIGFVHRNIYK